MGEVFSRQAFSTLIDNIDSCKSTLNWKVGIKDGKYGPMGEDLFAQTCLDSVGVRRKEAFDITTDGACPADRPKEERKNKKWKPNCAWAATPAMHPFKKTGVEAVLPGHHFCLRGIGPVLILFS